MSIMLRTPLYARHLSQGAKMVCFAGWEMPVSFGSVIEEHKAVRERCGIFDISHMGELVFRGADAAAKIEQIFSRKVSDLAVGSGRYGLLLTKHGTVVDDIIIYRTTEREFFAVVNASRIAADVAHIENHCGTSLLENQSERWAALALQGPQAVKIWQEYSGALAPARFGIAKFSTANLQGYVARTGYTGEDGVELLVAPDRVEQLWDDLVSRGAAPCGLGARDSLRVEAGYPLYGHELSEELTALESGAGWAVDFSKQIAWLGAEALRAERSNGSRRRIVYISTSENSAIPREGYSLFAGDQKIGTVTSGVFGPTVSQGVGMAIVEGPHFSEAGPFDMEIRGRKAKITFSKKASYKSKNL